MNPNELIPNNDNLEEQAPTLFGLKKSPSFKVPEGYFEGFSAQMTQHIAQLEKQKTTPKEELAVAPDFLTRVLQFFLKPGMAAPIITFVALIIFVASGLFHNNGDHAMTAGLNDEQLKTSLQSMPDAEIHSYMMNHIQTFDEDQLMHAGQEAVDFKNGMDRETSNAILNEMDDNTLSEAAL